MKTKLIGFALFALTAALVAVYPTLRGGAAAVVAPPSGPAEVEVVFVLDTTGSMGGLIAAAKEKIWSIATTLTQTEQAPRIRMGLVAYRDRGDQYVTRVVDLSADLDTMYATLMDFEADGGGDGPESVNRALADAVDGISWSQNPASYKVVFLVGDAPPHMDYGDEARYPEIVAAAVQKGIVVNTIQSGDVHETVAHWTRIAALGNGRYLQVEQAGGAVALATPFDAELATLAAELDDTRLYYGSDEDRVAGEARIASSHKLEAYASTAARARRAVFNASASGAASLYGEQELLDDVASGRVTLDAIPAEQLPAALRDLPAPEQHAVIAAGVAERAQLEQRIGALAAERDAYLLEAIEAAGGAADSLDVQIYDTVREQAAGKGLVYEGGPKF